MRDDCSRPPSKAYDEGWERMFGERKGTGIVLSKETMDAYKDGMFRAAEEYVKSMGKDAQRP